MLPWGIPAFMCWTEAKEEPRELEITVIKVGFEDELVS